MVSKRDRVKFFLRTSTTLAAPAGPHRLGRPESVARVRRVARSPGCCWCVLPLCLLVAIAGSGHCEQVVVNDVLARIRSHDFHPLNDEQTFTNDRTLQQHGVARLDDEDGRVRLLAIRDLTRALPQAAEDAAQGLRDENPQVRQIVAAALGIARASSAALDLERLLTEDQHALVRAQAAMSLGQMESERSLELLRSTGKDDPSRDVRHQCALAVDQIEKRMGATDACLQAYRNLDPLEFETVEVGKPAPDFALRDTDGDPWRLSDFKGQRWVVLIWIFADWCPVCHGEFRELIEMREAFEQAGVHVATLECHDTYRCRVMVGQELEPEYWFSRRSFKEAYTQGIWWPHLMDQAGAVGAKYGVDPMCFAVHAEYINRPSTIIIDPEGVVRFAYYGTYWGDRPSIQQTLEMIKQRSFEFEHPQRRRMRP